MVVVSVGGWLAGHEGTERQKETMTRSGTERQGDDIPSHSNGSTQHYGVSRRARSRAQRGGGLRLAAPLAQECVEAGRQRPSLRLSSQRGPCCDVELRAETLCRYEKPLLTSGAGNSGSSEARLIEASKVFRVEQPCRGAILRASKLYLPL
jgi:hypothetical protein